MILLGSQARVKREQKSLLEKLKTVVKGEFDRHELGVGNISSRLKEMMEKFEGRIRSVLNEGRTSGTMDAETAATEEYAGMVYCWGGGLRRVPHD